MKIYDLLLLLPNTVFRPYDLFRLITVSESIRFLVAFISPQMSGVTCDQREMADKFCSEALI